MISAKHFIFLDAQTPGFPQLFSSSPLSSLQPNSIKWKKIPRVELITKLEGTVLKLRTVADGLSFQK